MLRGPLMFNPVAARRILESTPSENTRMCTLLKAHEAKTTMKNITFTADEHVIEAAREQARAEQTTLNEQFRQWLEQYARKRQAARAVEVMDRLGQYVATGGRAARRDELNERR